MRLVKLFLLATILIIVPTLSSHAQLKKTADFGRLYKATIDDIIEFMEK